MSLYIRDGAVDELAKQVQQAINAPNKTEAVRRALLKELERAKHAIPLKDRIKRLQEDVRAMGPDDPDFDMKKFADEQWGGI